MAEKIDVWPKRDDDSPSASGSTATIVILRDEKVYVAYVGDSNAVICCKREKDYEAVKLTQDHKPVTQEKEQELKIVEGRF